MNKYNISYPEFDSNTNLENLKEMLVARAQADGLTYLIDELINDFVKTLRKTVDKFPNLTQDKFSLVSMISQEVNTKLENLWDKE